MKKYILAIYMMMAGCAMLTAQTKNTQTLVPLTERVNVQADSARINQIIDGCWVAVGTNKPHAIQRDFTNLFDGKPSYRFELKTEDNTLEGYAKGETKGRAEFSYCYATSDDFKGLPAVFGLYSFFSGQQRLHHLCPMARNARPDAGPDSSGRGEEADS